MGFSVSEETKKKTTKCKHDFSCLESGQCGDKPLCAVRLDGASVLYLETKGPVSCTYQISYGNCLLCMCPTHYALKMKYGK